MEVVALTADRVAVGGDAVARHGDGRIVFVSGAIPGERVAVEITDERRDFLRARVVDVLDPSPERIAPPCPNVARGCGGCSWQHVAPAAQRRLKVEMVADALARIARLADVAIEPGIALASTGYRTTLRVGVRDGRAALRRAESHELIALGSCLVADPRLDDLLRHARFSDDAKEVTLRVSRASGERMALVSPPEAAIEVPDDVAVGPRAALEEVVAGQRYRISAASFFQSRPDGAEALVTEVARAVAEVPGPLLDAYGGVGLFARALGDGREVELVERSPSAAADARHNLAGRDARVVARSVESWRPRPVSVVVADPARAGLGRRATRVLAATGAEMVVLVSCDAAAMARDARLLVGEGYRLRRATLVDMFPHTAHVEVVTVFDRRGKPGP